MEGLAAVLPQVVLRIGAELRREGSGGVFEHVNPATARVQATVPLAGPAEIDAAASAAASAFVEWRRWRPAARRDALIRLAQRIELNRAELKRIAALENATPLRIADALVTQSQEWLHYYAGWADKLEGSVSGSFVQGQDFTYSQPEPYGVIGVIVTWNVPLLSLCMKLAPALIVGNTAVVKPSEYTPFTAELFARLALEAGIPSGVINVLPGTAAAGHALVVNRHVEKISFTGGPATARKIMLACAEHLKPSVMELGGKSACIVFEDADLDAAVMNSVTMGLCALAGQACIMGSRVLVQARIYDEFVERLVAAARAIPCGDPSSEQVLFGPVISEASCERILGIIERARAHNAGRLVSGGQRMGGEYRSGFFVEPTIFADVDPMSELAQQEIFGPVLSVIRFETEQQAIEIANNTVYGLAAYLHTRDLTRTHRMADLLKAGSVYVNGSGRLPPNAPFGGLGESGFGREGGRAGIEEFVRPKTVAIAQLP